MECSQARDLVVEEKVHFKKFKDAQVQACTSDAAAFFDLVGAARNRHVCSGKSNMANEHLLELHDIYIIYTLYIYTDWWFGTFLFFHNIWDNPSH